MTDKSVSRQDDHSKLELARIIEEQQAELKEMLERASAVDGTEEKSKCQCQN